MTSASEQEGGSTVSSRTRIARILRDESAAAVFNDFAPEVRDSPHREFMITRSLDEYATLTGRVSSWTAQVVGALASLELHVERGADPGPRFDYESDDVELGSAAWTGSPEPACWQPVELRFDGPSHGNPFTDVAFQAQFISGECTVDVTGFYDGNGEHVLRFLPSAPGAWQFRTRSNARSLDGISGSLTVGEAAGAHGPVTADGFHFRHRDGEPFRPIGTTCYAWTHQSDALEAQTLDTLRDAPFNKVRMCVFPKAYAFNDEDPPRHAFERRADGAFDELRLDPEFFRHLERRILDLAALGIEADLILFHPYDRWGYANLSPAAEDRYVRYLVARLGAFPNVLWSLANEYDFLGLKDDEDWERLGNMVRSEDPFGHLLSIHNGLTVFDHGAAWITHASIQKTDPYRTTENVDRWRATWAKPVIVDEFGYEGDLEQNWGNLTPQELVRRMWEATTRGGYSSHGETYRRADEVLWWSKGGELHGESVERIRFLRDILHGAPTLEPDPLASWEYPTAGETGSYWIQYFGTAQPSIRPLELADAGPFRVEVIDTWNMTVTDAGTHYGSVTIDLPGRPYIAVRVSADRTG